MLYYVHFSEEDTFDNTENYCKMRYTISPSPKKGNFFLRQDGIFEITQVFKDEYYNDHIDVYFQPVATQCENGDMIALTTNENRIFKCSKYDNVYYFEKVTFLSLVQEVNELRKTIATLDEYAASLVKEFVVKEEDEDKSGEILINI